MSVITKLDYLYRCVDNRFIINEKNWYIKAFTIVTLKNEDPADLHVNDICIRNDGLYVKLNEENDLAKIVDYEPGKALFDHQEKITIDSNIISSVNGKTVTKIGRLLLNAVIFPKHVEKRTGFLNPPLDEKLDVDAFTSVFESRIANPEDRQTPTSITVKEAIEISDNIMFFDSLGTYLVTACTPKTITRAEGITEYRDKLIKEMGDDIHDSVKLVEFENKLRDYDKEYLKGDPAAENVFVGKTAVGRFKTYGIYGKGLDFVNDASNDTLVMRSVADGLSTDPEELPKYFNDLRYGSFARGSNTALGGYVYKILQRSLGGLVIDDKPCNTTRGYVKKMTKQEVKYAIGRYIKQSGKWHLITSKEEAKALLGKVVEMRSPVYCTTKGNKVCYACMSMRYKYLSNGVTNIASENSSAILTMFLKLNHGTETSVTDIKREDLLT